MDETLWSTDELKEYADDVENWWVFITYTECLRTKLTLFRMWGWLHA